MTVHFMFWQNFSKAGLWGTEKNSRNTASLRYLATVTRIKIWRFRANNTLIKMTQNMTCKILIVNFLIAKPPLVLERDDLVMLRFQIVHQEDWDIFFFDGHSFIPFQSSVQVVSYLSSIIVLISSRRRRLAHE